jgi:hypothetical protein
LRGCERTVEIAALGQQQRQVVARRDRARSSAAARGSSRSRRRVVRAGLRDAERKPERCVVGLALRKRAQSRAAAS